MITASDLAFRASATAGYEVLSRANNQPQSSTYNAFCNECILLLFCNTCACTGCHQRRSYQLLMLMLHLLVGGFACDVPGFWVCIYYAMIIWCSCSVSAGPAGAAVGFEAAATT